jgi:hypothetical protein
VANTLCEKIPKGYFGQKALLGSYGLGGWMKKETASTEPKGIDGD